MNYTKIAFSLTFALAVATMAPAFAFAESTLPQTQDNGTSAGIISKPATQDNGTSANPSPAPAVQDNGTSAGTISKPATQDNGTSAGTVAKPATQDNGTSADVASTPTTPSTGNGSGSVSSGGGSGFVSGGSSGGSLPILTNIGQCQYITAYMKIGQINSALEVTKLQNFLKNTEQMNVTVTGIFDAQTFQAVKTFQVKYASDILAPWGASVPTGRVYITTSKKINEIYCKTTFTLTSKQAAEISAYKTALNTVKAPVSDQTGLNGNVKQEVTSTSTDTTHDDSQVGAVAKTSIASKIWKFIKRIFGR